MDFVTQIAISRGYTIAHTTTTLNMAVGSQRLASTTAEEPQTTGRPSNLLFGKGGYMATPEEQITPADAAIVTTGTGRKARRSMIFPKA